MGNFLKIGDLVILWYNGKSQIERGSEMDVKLRYKVKKIKIVFFDIDDILWNLKIGFILVLILIVFK